MTGTVYAGAAQWVAASPGARRVGLFRLGAGDEGWQSLATGLPEAPEVRALALHPDDPGTLYAASQVGPYRSTDGGDSWTAMALPEAEVTWSILVHPGDPKVLLCGTVGTGVYRSDDAGRRWRRLPIAPPASACAMGFPTRVIDLTMDPSNPDEMYAALEVAGVVRSLDGGRSWSDCNAGLLAFAEGDAYKSRIGSDTDSEGMLDSHAITVSAACPGTVFLATRMGLFASPDRGASWRDLEIGRFSPLRYARDVVVSPHDPRVMLGAFSKAAVSDEGALYRSDDLGQSWRRFDTGVAMQSTLMNIGASRSSPDRVYCATRRGQVFGTEDGGSSWRSHPLPRGVEGVYAVVCT